MMTSALENFDADFAAPGEWAAMYRACGLQVIPCFNPMRSRWRFVEAPSAFGMDDASGKFNP
jgi:hypothetical protein